MASSIEIPVETLRRAAQIVLDHVDQTAGPVVRVEHDMIWSIPIEQRGDVYTDPTQFTIGQISECLEHLQRIADDPSAATSFALVWLAEVLRSVGETVVA